MNAVAVRVAFACCLAAGTASAAPLIFYRGVVNAASYMPQALPGGGIAQGSIFSIFGSGIGPSTPAQAQSFPLDTKLSGVSITVAAGGKTVNAIPVYVSSSQISAIMPSNAPLGTASVRVSFNGTSNPVPVRIVASAFGIFAVNSAGMGPGILQNFVTPDSQPVNSPTVSAHAGQVVILWGTGLGPALGPDNQQPSAGNLPTQVEVFVGGKSAQVLYSGRAPCCSGTDQIDFQIPDDVPLGCWTPVYVRTGGSTVSNVVTMAIQSGSGVCSDPANPFSPVVVSGGTAGGFIAVRATTHEDVGTVAPVDVNTDFQASAFYSSQYRAFPIQFGRFAASARNVHGLHRKRRSSRRRPSPCPGSAWPRSRCRPSCQADGSERFSRGDNAGRSTIPSSVSFRIFRRRNRRNHDLGHHAALARFLRS